MLSENSISLKALSNLILIDSISFVIDSQKYILLEDSDKDSRSV